MTDFVVSITDEAHLAGITWAREERNATEAGEPLADDAAYVSWVMTTAAASYARQKSEAEARKAYEDSLAPPASQDA